MPCHAFPLPEGVASVSQVRRASFEGTLTGYAPISIIYKSLMAFWRTFQKTWHRDCKEGKGGLIQRDERRKVWRHSASHAEVFNDSGYFTAEIFSISHSTRENKFIIVNSTMERVAWTLMDMEKINTGRAAFFNRGC
jgi:hypothetical protein